MNYHQRFSPKLPSIQQNNLLKSEAPLWVKISTLKPKCVYYFGSFNNKSEAIDALPGYIEDLEGEEAEGISIEIERKFPRQLTISAE